MRILFISRDLSGAGLCYRLAKEGNDVRLYQQRRPYARTPDILQNIVVREKDMSKGIRWVGKKGLIVVDDTGFGSTQDSLRAYGYAVVGGCDVADIIENDREYCYEVFDRCGIQTIPHHRFLTIPKAIEFLQKKEGPWVIKQNGHLSKTINYVGSRKDNKDMISVLRGYDQNSYFAKMRSIPFDLQKKVEGIEIGVGRYFNGKDWIGPIEVNMEHKDFFGYHLGPKTYEMGTLLWYTENEKNILFQKTLARLKNFLRKHSFHGDFDINCIVNKDGIFPLEATARFGYPALQAQTELHKTPWSTFLLAVAGKKKIRLEWRKGYSTVVLVATPPFPYYQKGRNAFSPKGSMVSFSGSLSKEDFRHIHLEEVSKNASGEYVVAGHEGYILHVSGFGQSVREARRKMYNLVNKITIPKMYYRKDIGLDFMRWQKKTLRLWGYGNIFPKETKEK